jgi:hypothetical protein
MTKDEALKLALNDLILEYHMETSSFAKRVDEIFEQALAAQPAVPDALTSADIQEHIEYVAGWNDCRQTMLEMMK